MTPVCISQEFSGIKAHEPFAANTIFYFSILITIILRLPWLKVPFFISDEALILTIGGQISQDGAIYGKGFIDTRGPGGYYLSAFFSYLFGFGNTFMYHLTGIVVQIIILFLLRKLGRQLLERSTANIACLFYAIFSYAYLLHDTLAFNVEFICIPFLLGSAIIFLDGIIERTAIIHSFKNRAKIFLSGLLCALIFSIKQVIAGCFGVYLFIMFYSWIKKEITFEIFFKKGVILTSGLIFGMVLIFIPSIMLAGPYDTLYWLALFNLKFHSPGLTTKIISFIQRIMHMYLAQPIFWTLTSAWIMNLIFSYKYFSLDKMKINLFILFMILAQWYGALVGGAVTGHNILPALPFMALAAADIMLQIVNWIKLNANLKSLTYKISILAFILVAILPPLLNFTLFPEGIQTADYSAPAFWHEKIGQKQDPISQTVSFIHANTTNQDRIFVLGRLYEMYPLTKRLPPTLAFGMTWFEKRSGDAYLTKYYEYIISVLQQNPRKQSFCPVSIMAASILLMDRGRRLGNCYRQNIGPLKSSVGMEN